MPDPALLTPLGRQLLDDLPPVLRDDPDYQGVIHAGAREIERFTDHVVTLSEQFFPQTADPLLKVWEAQLRVAIEPTGATLAERRIVVEAHLLKVAGDPAGSEWEANVTKLIGPGWSYEEHQPGVGGSPPANTIRITVPFPPDTGSYGQVERLLRDITPAHLDIILISGEGFMLDNSQLDQEQFEGN